MGRSFREVGRGLALGAALFWSFGAEAAGRVALVIGNSDYVDQRPLANPPLDAEGVAAALRDIGFEVTVLANLTNAQMRAGLSAFTLKASGSEMAIVYYAGHGIESFRSNYLIPVDAKIEHELQIRNMGVPLADVMSAVAPASRLRLVILDACRNDPYSQRMTIADPTRSSQTRGLAPVEPGGGVHVAYAAREGSLAKDGEPGRNSPFAGALIQALREPPRPVDRLLGVVRDRVMAATNNEQEPVVYGAAFSSDVFLNIPEAPRPPPQPEAPPEPLRPQPGSRSADYLREAQSGDAEAMQRIGAAYFHGVAGAPQSDAEALRWFSAGAEAGNGMAMHSLGVMHSDGRGVAQNDAEAVRWWRAGAEAGNAMAMHNLGVMHQDGRGLAQNYAEARRWFRAGAEAGSPAAMHNLGVMYRDGRGVAQSDAEAVRWFRAGAEAGNAIAMGALGAMYENGRGVAQSDAEALRWFRAGAEAGDAGAMYNLGVMYENGRGVPRDLEQARRFYRQALNSDEAVLRNAAQQALNRLDGR